MFSLLFRVGMLGSEEWKKLLKIIIIIIIIISEKIKTFFNVLTCD